MNNSQESINIRFLLWRDGMPASVWSNILREKLRWDLREIENFLKGGSVNFQQLQDLSDSFDRLDEELATDDLLSQEGTDIVCENLRALFKDMEHGEKKKIAEHLGVEETKVTEEANFIDDLGADSLDTVELVMAFEEEFGSEISDSEAEKILTVGDAIKFIESNSAK